jgi:hypothetical protein
MQIVAAFIVTNITDQDIQLSGARLARQKDALGWPSVKDTNSRYHGWYAIPAKRTVIVDVDIWIKPPFAQEGHAFRSVVLLYDQFGNEHSTEAVEFSYK